MRDTKPLQMALVCSSSRLQLPLRRFTEFTALTGQGLSHMHHVMVLTIQQHLPSKRISEQSNR